MAEAKEKLDQLHALLAEKLHERIERGEATAADLNVARQFLKDNGIDCVRKPGNPLDDLTASMPDLPDAEDEYVH